LALTEQGSGGRASLNNLESEVFMMSVGKNVEERPLVHAIVISERPIDSEAEQSDYLFKAFPEQFTFDVADGRPVVAYKSTFTVRWLTWDQCLKPSHKKALLACIGGVEEGSHILPSNWIQLTAAVSDDERREWQEGIRYTRNALQGLVGNAIYQSCARTRGGNMDYADSPNFVRTWKVVDGPEIKDGLFGKPRPSRILAIGIFRA